MFGRLSGYSVNVEKSSYMGFNITDEIDGQIMRMGISGRRKENIQHQGIYVW